MADQGGISISDDGGEVDVSAFVFLRLYEFDQGSLVGRASHENYVNRTPVCVDLNSERAILTVTNSGAVASDLVTIEWRMAFCTAGYHTPQDGFTISHASESDSLQGDSFLNVDFLLPGESRAFVINFGPSPAGLENIYFQARVSTLWSGSVPMDHWNIADDPAVTEAHARP